MLKMKRFRSPERWGSLAVALLILMLPASTAAQMGALASFDERPNGDPVWYYVMEGDTIEVPIDVEGDADKVWYD